MKRIYEDLAYGHGPVEDSYWRTTVTEDFVWPAVSGGVDCEFVVVGGGYTGLTVALDLAQAGADVVLLEAETPGWGASGRNGGFCCLGGAKLKAKDLFRKYGNEDGRRFLDAERLAVEQVAETLETHAIDADVHSQGETLLAHKLPEMDTLRQLSREMRAYHGATCDVVSKDDLAGQGMASPEFHGAVTTPIGFALNPLKYALGLASATVGAGVRVFGHSPASEIRHDGGRWQIETPGGGVRARTLLMATNGYSSENLPRWMAGRYLPVQTNILVTRELSDDELAAQGWTSTQMCYDTRHLLHYFRLMPNRRMLFGLRGAMRATEDAHAEIRTRARTDFDRVFPAWRQVETPYFWSGLVAMSRNLVPFAGPMAGLENAFAAMCYHGNGVAMGSYAGARLADQALGRPPRQPLPDLMQRPMGRFPLGRYRRALLPAVYRWYDYLDQR